MNPSELCTAYLTIVRKEVGRFFRVWKQTLVPPIITTLLYYVIFGQFIGNRIGEVGGMNYMNFIVPGLVAMSVIMNSFSHVVSSVYMAKFQKTIEEMLVSPMPYPLIILGYITGGLFRGIFTGSLVFLVAFFFTDIHIFSPLLMIAVMVMTASIFSLLGLINGLIAESFDSISVVPNFVLTPLTYLGGVFYAISTLPPFWQQISLFNPIFYIVDALRFALYGQSEMPF